VNIKLKIRCCF